MISPDGRCRRAAPAHSSSGSKLARSLLTRGAMRVIFVLPSLLVLSTLACGGNVVVDDVGTGRVAAAPPPPSPRTLSRVDHTHPPPTRPFAGQSSSIALKDPGVLPKGLLRRARRRNSSEEGTARPWWAPDRQKSLPHPPAGARSRARKLARVGGSSHASEAPPTRVLKLLLRVGGSSHEDEAPPARRRKLARVGGSSYEDEAPPTRRRKLARVGGSSYEDEAPPTRRRLLLHG